MKTFTLLMIFSLFSLEAVAYRCSLGDFEQRVQGTPNVFIGRVVGVKLHKSPLKDERKPVKSYRVKIVKMLKSNGVFEKRQGEFTLPAEYGWGDYLSYKRGQLIMFFFHDDLSIKCNQPLVIE